MVYGFGIIGFGIGLGSFCRLSSSSGFLLFFGLFFCAGFSISPLSFGFFLVFFWPCILFPLDFEHPLSCTASLFYALFILVFLLSLFFLKTWLLTRKGHNFIGFAYI